MKRLAATVLAASALLLAACGSEEENPPPAEPAASPPLADRPVGQVKVRHSEAEGVAVDGETGLAAVSFRDPDRIELIDVASGRTVKRVPTPDPARHLTLAAPGGPVLAPIEYSDQLLRVELPGGATSSVSVGDFPHDAAQADDGRIFVSDEGGDTISVVEGDAVEVELPSPEQPGGIAASGDTVAVVAVAAREIAFLDAAGLQQIAAIEGGAGPSHIVAGPDDPADGRNRFYVADTGGDAILVYEGGDEPRLLDRTNLPGSPYGLAVDARRDRLWVTQTARNRVVELEVTDLAPKIVASYPTVRQPNSVGVDERTGDVVVVGRDTGAVQIFNPDDVAGDRGMSRLEDLGDLVEESDEARTPPAPPVPAVGPFNRGFWRSPLRGEWLTSFLGSTLLPLVIVGALTGFLSHAAYNPALGSNDVSGGFEVDLYFFDWPTQPAWLYSLTQSLHLIAGFAAIPILLAKLWSVIPRLFERPPARSIAHGLERLSVLLLVGSALFLFVTGVINVQYWLPFGFSFVPAHYYAALIFIGALALHLVLKLPIVARTFRREGAFKPLGEGIARMRVADPEEDTLAAVNPAAPTISRRGMLGAVGLGSLGLLTMTAGSNLLGSIREIALLSPRGQSYGDGPNDFQINKTAELVGITPEQTGDSWRLTVSGPGDDVMLSRDDLLGMTQHTEHLPIACVEGWTTWQTWTGVRLADLADLAGVSADDDSEVLVESLQEGGAFAQATLASNQIFDDESLLALRVNGADLSPDHGYPARVIVPALPGVHNTKWVKRMTFTTA